jgi:hypothetical protein
VAIRDRNIDTRSGSRQNYVDVTITSAQVLALNATPVTVVAAPGAGFANIFEGAVAITDGGTAYAGIAAGEDLSFKYTNGSGQELGVIETTGWLDQTTAQVRYCRPQTGAISAGTVSSITPVANAVIVAQFLSGEITTGNYPIKLRIFFRTVPTVSANL